MIFSLRAAREGDSRGGRDRAGGSRAIVGAGTGSCLGERERIGNLCCATAVCWRTLGCEQEIACAPVESWENGRPRRSEQLSSVDSQGNIIKYTDFKIFSNQFRSTQAFEYIEVLYLV